MDKHYRLSVIQTDRQTDRQRLPLDTCFSPILPLPSTPSSVCRLIRARALGLQKARADATQPGFCGAANRQALFGNDSLAQQLPPTFGSSAFIA